ncbi:MAG TPA: hypothetical protein VM051_02590 [Usitatibacter sp.]|nr:hypothetical protein [Usitatibacter sp.]
MSARQHRVLLHILVSVSFVVSSLAVGFAGSRPAMARWFEATLGHYFVGQLFALVVLPLAIVVGVMFLVHGSINSFVPARCPKCGGRAYRYAESGRWLVAFSNGCRVIYWCSVCGNREDLGYSNEG